MGLQRVGHDWATELKWTDKSQNWAVKTTGTDPALGGNCSLVRKAQHCLTSTTCVRVMKGRWVGSCMTLDLIRSNLPGIGRCCRNWDLKFSMVENSLPNAGDLGSTPGSGRFPGEGSGTYYSILASEIPRTEEAWQATVHGVAKSRKWVKWLRTKASSREEVRESYYPIWPQNIQY